MKTFSEIYNEWYHLGKVDLARKVYEEQQKSIIDYVEINKKNIAMSEWYGYTTEEYVDADDLLEVLK